MEEKNNGEILDVDLTEEPMQQIEIPKQETVEPKRVRKNIADLGKPLVNCLRNERIIVRHIDKKTNLVKDPRHILSGGMAETATRIYTVPRLQSGILVNVLTDSEKDYLEYALGLEQNELSVYKKKDNFWEDDNPNGINKVILTKQDNYLDLSKPDDYIRYKILLANKQSIAPSLEVLERNSLATYEFVIITEGAENKLEKDKMTYVMKCYKEYGKIEENKPLLSMVVEILEGRPMSPNQKIEWLQTKCNEHIQRNAKLFLQVITDPMLSTKVLIKNAINAGLIVEKGNYLYLAETNEPLCDNGEEPVLDTVAQYLNKPKNQSLKLSLDVKLKVE